MKSDEIKQKTITATKWSSITEILSKVITPIINMVLARILAPEAFGILATVTMVISFAEVFVESGFQKFLIQHEFKSDKEEQEYTSVAFWTNLVFSLLIWGIIVLFQKQIAKIAGNDGLGHVIAISGVMIPMYGIIGIQNCIIKKKLQFRKLFYVRIPSALVPLVITLPLALIGFDYWALVIGNIAGVLIRSVLLVIIGGYKPQWYFNYTHLKFMLRFGMITLLDGLAIWATSWVDSLLIAAAMSEYQLGLYKNSVGTITTLFNIVSAAVTPVLYASLSRLQNDDEAFRDVFAGTQKILCTFLLPMGAGVYLYKDLATKILFGDAWSEASFIIGITAVTLAFRTIFVSFNSEAYRAKGKFYIPLLLQLLDLAILIPTCIISSQISFETLVYARAIARLDLVIPGFLLLYMVCHISFFGTLKSLLPNFIAVSVMWGAALLLQSIGTSMIWSFASIVCCVFVYFGVLALFKKDRKMIMEFISNLFSKLKRRA